MPPPLELLQRLLTKGIKATEQLWPPRERAYQWVHQAKESLVNPEQSPGAQVRERYLAYVGQMQDQQATVGPLAEAIDHCCHITDNASGWSVSLL